MKRYLLSSLICIMLFLIMSIDVLAAVTYDFTLQNGDVGVTYTTSKSRDKVTKADETNMTIVSQSKTWSGGSTSVNIYNATSSTATLSFDYKIDGDYNSCSLDTSGTKFSQLIDSGAYVTITLKGKSDLGSYDDVTLSIQNINLSAAKESSKVTVQYESSLGSVSIDETEIDSGEFVEVVLNEGVLLEATAKSGVTFQGWVNEADGSVLSTATSYTLKTGEDLTVKAVFTGTNSAPFFGVGAATTGTFSSGFLGTTSNTYYKITSYTYIFDDLNDAATAAKNSVSKYIVLLNSATLPAGDYTIPSGVTMLIPFDDENTLYTTIPKAENHGSSYTPKPTAFRTLTMAKGANLTVNGAVSLSAEINAANSPCAGVGSPCGYVSFINMETGSSITINGGGKLYAWGYITGSGSITAKDDAEVYECFQFEDFRGGSQISSMTSGVFPLSQYYIQNIEAPLTLETGAKEVCVSAVYMSSAVLYTSLNFVGESSSMFNVTKGTLTKYYDGSTDRLIVTIKNGTTNLAPIELKIATTTLDSEDYNLPINGNITVNIEAQSVVSIKQDLALLPGVVINIENGSEMEIVDSRNVYIYDYDEWKAGYCNTYNNVFLRLTYAPGRTYTRTTADLTDAKILVNGTLNAENGYIYTTEGGANICSSGSGIVVTKAGSSTNTQQFHQYDSDSSKANQYIDIPITPARLKNRDESYTETAGASTTTTYYYCSTCGYWVTHKTAVATIIGDSSAREDYHSLNEAVVAYNGTGYIQMLLNSTDAVSISGTVYLDLNGCDVSGVTLSGTLYGIDSTSDGYGTPGGSITVSGSTVAAAANNVNGKDYVANVESSTDTTTTYSFYRFAIMPTAYQFYFSPNNGHSHLGFAATVRCSDADVLKAHLVDVGFTATTGTEIFDLGNVSWYKEEQSNGTLPGNLEWISCILLDLEESDFGTSYTPIAAAAFDSGRTSVITGTAGSISLYQALSLYVQENPNSDVTAFIKANVSADKLS